MDCNFYTTAFQFIDVLLNYQFDNVILDFAFERKTYSLCDVIITNKITMEIYQGSFGIFDVLGMFVCSIKVVDRKLITITDDGQLGYSANLNEHVSEFINCLENNLIGVTD